MSRHKSRYYAAASRLRASTSKSQMRETGRGRFRPGRETPPVAELGKNLPNFGLGTPREREAARDTPCPGPPVQPAAYRVNSPGTPSQPRRSRSHAP
jgi:hypothetical protein